MISKLTYVKTHGNCYLANVQYAYAIQTLSLSPSKLHTYLNALSSSSFFFLQAYCETSHPMCYEYKCKMGARSISELSETAPTPAHPNLIFTFHCIWICLLASLLSTTAGEHNMLQRLLCSDGINVSWFNLYPMNHIS